MKLTVNHRKDLKKSETNQIRREGDIPAILYGKGQTNQNIFIKGNEFQEFKRTLKNGLLATTIFELKDGDHLRKAIVKDVHYHPTTYSVMHLDFLALEENEMVTVNVPIQVTGVADCVGIKLGGTLRQVIRSIKVKCLPKNIPQEFVLDVADLDLGKSRRLSDIAMPSSVSPIAKMNEVAVVIAKR